MCMVVITHPTLDKVQWILVIIRVIFVAHELIYQMNWFNIFLSFYTIFYFYGNFGTFDKLLSKKENMNKKWVSMKSTLKLKHE